VDEVRLRARALPGVLWRSLRGIRSIAPHNRREYLLVLALTAVVEVMLRVMPLPRIARMLGVGFDHRATIAEGTDRPSLPDWAHRRLRVVGRVLRRWPVDGECLRESLVAGQRLRRLDPVLRIGVAKVDGALTAHAWLEIAGRSLDPRASTYVPLGTPER
jgi:hypothetical protein